MRKLEQKLLRQAISREQRRPHRQRPEAVEHGYCADRTCAPCRAVDAWGVVPEDRRPRPLCAVCEEHHPPEDSCPPQVTP